LRILYSHRIQSRDGQSVHIEAMVAAFRALGHEVVVVGPRSYGRGILGHESRAVAMIRARLPPWIGSLAELAYNLPAFWRLRRVARRVQPDLIYERYNLFYLGGAWLARRTGVKLFLEVNAPLAEERARFGRLGLPGLARRLEAVVWCSADKVLAVTDVLKRIIMQAGVPAHRIEVVPNGIDPTEFAGVSRNLVRHERIVLGFVGFVREWHGLDSVIKAMAEARDSAPMDLVVVGDGPARADLEALSVGLGLADRVRFTGLCPREQVPGLIASFDIALQPRVVEYASPLKVFEYMAAGRAIVAPNLANVREILTHERNALLFDPAQPAAMWQAAVRLAADAALRERLGAAALAEIARRDYTWIGNARRVIAWA
jgi:glycosyltransferase involved in cell wall biosynthesis